MEEVDDDERREAAIASASALNPNFKPAPGGATQSQLAKFQELHRRRLKIKARSESNKKSKGIVDGTTKPHLKDVNATELKGKSASNTVEDSRVPISKGSNMRAFSTKLQDDVKAKMPSNKRQKLYWGYHLPLFLLSFQF
ncbi:hypothetical protein RJ639_023504 [Escallonia herrerae]|uniref:Uncharacterized protein n=1 Tax=Escallonia herrerae TaxID=1293975 RepID=A0AA88UZZ8_9ASTE|nr:hypothetical protein RJ639_023504 [Escallonia herrerae]